MSVPWSAQDPDDKMADFLQPCRFLAYLSLFLGSCHLVGSFPAKLSHVVKPRGLGSRVEDTQIRLLTGEGWTESTFGKVDAAAVGSGRPVRSFPTYKGQRNYPGLLWTATTGSLVGYESLLERDRLWLADFDPAVRQISGQPF